MVCSYTVTTSSGAVFPTGMFNCYNYTCMICSYRVYARGVVNCAWANTVSIKLMQSAILSVLCGYTDMLRSCDLLSKYFSELTGEAKETV